jgi:hypothetical protein
MRYPKLILSAILLSAGAVALPVSANAAADNTLVAHWTFDDAANPAETATSAKYATTVSKHGIATAPGVFGNALVLNAADGHAISVAADLLPEDLRELTFSSWICLKEPPTGNSTILRKEDGEMRLLFSIQNGGQFLSLGLNCGRNYAELDALLSPDEIADGNWHLVAGTFDGRTMRTYLDGREVGSFERQVPLNTIRDYIATRKIGPFFIGSFNGSNDRLNGQLDDLRFYKRALTAAELNALYAEGKQSTPPAAKAAQDAACPLYKKAATFLETLALLDTSALTTLTPAARVEIQRLLRADFPAEVNTYISKQQKNPLDNLALAKDARRAYATELAPKAFEYLPLTDFQWAALSVPERAKWERVKAIKNLVADTAAPIPGSVLNEMEALIEARPGGNEPVAKYVVPATPETRTRTAEEARAVLEADWLFQTGGKPTIARSLAEIGYTRKLAERLGIPAPTTLDELEKQAKAKPATTTDKDLYLAIRALKREIAFKNPALDFDSIVYIDNPNPAGREWQHETRHRLGYQAVPGGRLLVQKGLSPDGKLTQLLPAAPLHGTFWRPDLSYDATKVLVSYKPHNEKTFHLYEIGVDGTGFRQLTGGIFDDLDPVYLPDQKNILFTTTRGYLYVRCMPPTNAMVTARMALNTKPGDKTIYITSRNGEPEYTPSVLADGRVIYTRWEYTDKPLWRAQALWTMNQDTTNVQTFWGNQSVWPDLLKDARSIPGSSRIMFTGSAHHNWFSGSIGIIDPTKGLNFPHGLTKVTQEVEWPESGNGPTDPKENDTYHTSGKYSAYYSPYPLSEKDFLVSAKREGKFVLLLMDTDGNREIINEGHFNIWDAKPVRKRPIPLLQPDLVKWPAWDNRDKPGTGVIYSNNVYENAPPELKDKAKYLRIWSIEHKTYTYWNKRPTISTGPEISINQSDGVKKIIGTVPIEPDGSVNFNAPSGIALHFQLLDKDQRALQTMKSFTGVQPGETRACFGCHEQKMNAPRSNKIGQAMKRTPSSITPAPWEDITVGYERYVQTALDQHCGSCHGDSTKAAYKAFNSNLRPGVLGFKEPYATLLGNPTWGRAYHGRTGTGAFGWADTILVESYSQRDPAAYSTFPPMKRLSYKSRLVKRFAGEKVYPEDKHPVIKADKESLLRVIHWVDAMGPYYGSEELRNIEDPNFPGRDWISQPPRIHSAPIVQRPGPFDAFYTDTDPAYFPPAPGQFNALPYGVNRSTSNIANK